MSLHPTETLIVYIFCGMYGFVGLGTLFHIIRHLNMYLRDDYDMSRWQIQKFSIRFPILIFLMATIPFLAIIIDARMELYVCLEAFIQAYTIYLLFLLILSITSVEAIFHFIETLGTRHAKRLSCIQCWTFEGDSDSQIDTSTIRKNMFFRWEAGLFQFFAIKPLCYLGLFLYYRFFGDTVAGTIPNPC